jgi:hypothetical protein
MYGNLGLVKLNCKEFLIYFLPSSFLVKSGMGKKRIWERKKIPDPQQRRNVRNIHNSLLSLPVTHSVSMLTHVNATHLSSSEADRVAVLVQELLGVLGRLPDDLLVLGPEGLVHLVHRLKAVPAVYEHRAWHTKEKVQKHAQVPVLIYPS